MPRALRARVLAAQRSWTTALLPDWVVTGVAPTSAAAWERSLARSRIGPTWASSLGQVDLADATQRLEDHGLGVLAQGGGQGPVQVGEAAKQAAQQPDLDGDGSRPWTSGSSWSTATGAARSR
jgi:hypothetical protein